MPHECKFHAWNQRFRAAFRKESTTLAIAPPPTVQSALEDVRTTGIAVHGPDGRIRLDVAEEEEIDLDALRRRSHSTMDEEEDLNLNLQLKLEQDALPPVLNICIVIVGTRGDVQPFVAIAQRLQQDGHRVRLATHAIYRDFVTSYGLEFYPLGGDPKELAAYMVKTGGHLIPTKMETLQKDVPRNMQMVNEILHSTWPAVAAADPEGGGVGVRGKPFRAHAIISNPVTYGHIHVAERLGVPLHIMFPQPWVPTTAFPHPLANMMYSGKKQKRNYVSYKLVDLLMWQGTEGMVNEFRTEVLGLRKIRKGDGGRDMLLDLHIPHAFMWSPELVPKPEDWGDLYDVVGTVSLQGTASTYTPSPELEEFLGDDGGPIFVGFGSMVLDDPRATTKMIIEAAKQADARVLIQSSWSDMAGDLVVPDNIFFLGNCPHDWLMPRVSAVVHHGGAGTTAAGLLAGKPTFIVPFFGDQHFWGWAVSRAGVGVAPCPIEELTMEKLRAAFEELQTQELRSRAMAIQQKMQKEDGAEEAVRCFYRHLPVQDMRCDLDHVRVATRWCQRRKLKLCEVCDFVVASQPENLGRTVVDYHFVDYTARGPSDGFAGASSGAAAFFHELGGAFKDVIVKPAKGFRDEGPKGAVIGVVKGVSGLVIRPVHGVALFADHIAAGHANYFNETGSRRRGSVFDKTFMAAIGKENGLSDSYTSGGNSEELETHRTIGPKKEARRKVELDVSDKDKLRYQARFREILSEKENERNSLDRIQRSSYSSSSPSETETDDSSPREGISVISADFTTSGNIGVNFSVRSTVPDTISEAKLEEWHQYSKLQKVKSQHILKNFVGTTVPPMNICLATIGTWDNNVKQLVAIGLRMAADGHRVRIAVNEEFRDDITGRGLEFYPLAGGMKNVHDFIKYLRDTKDANLIKRCKAGRPVIGPIKDLVYSLWPAANGADPHGRGQNIPGEHFRADALLWHPLLFGHVHVAERLGIPLQCFSLVPLSPTFSMPHVLSSTFMDDISQLGREFKKTNWLSYGVVDTVLWRGMEDIVDDFREDIGLTGHYKQPSPLVEWRIPHVYLWNPALLQRPVDWGRELSVAGYVTLKDEREMIKMRKFKWSRSLNDFTLATRNPVIYFGVSTYSLASVEIDRLLQTIDEAAEKAKVKIIFQAREGRADQALYHSENIYEVESKFPYSLILRKVAATIHWGEPAIVEEGLAAGKPVGICVSLSSQYFAACMCVTAGVGIPPIDLRTCTAESLVSSFQHILRPEIREQVEEIAKTFKPEESLENAVETFYMNLPLRAMRCDVDEDKIARIYDPRLELKLSFDAYIAIQPLRSHDDTDDVSYKPLYYDGRRPAKYSLRDFADDEELEDVKPTRGLESIRKALASFASHESNESVPQAPRSVLSRLTSRVALVVEKPKFWSSAQEEAADRKVIMAAYERVLQQRATQQVIPKTRKSSLCRHGGTARPVDPATH
ncbi:Sterol 3-beta-glucosyltransferase [Phytophthora rubi]|uniref:Sterol 3-beta-glucosyltransferase n=1 Tax=Phytophthora rubi TaxID=129364 RepID=A0A6A4DTN4_9STRA|nr:Sterol 3-beta-glucosyltransferase [Phytophthora rubi]KAE9010430.1 Sterol 3-beta-glucosyltransferase [Phytophthora rubi]KAE9307431.1 Sterol 3-beta-glucosyltransferase [Phytophthora rubi]